MAENDVPLHAAPDEEATKVAPPEILAGRVDVPIQIGPYRLLRPLGEGGMGEVWEAHQTEPLERTVAIKLLKLGRDTEQFLARFESERQALALMEHPSIARVIDGGATATGRPYFVMEYVRGEPITAYCDRHRLGVRERLELFVGVCAGVQHAHQKGVLHRDLKPSNVLVAEVDGRPAPKIIDFGVAKAIGQSLTERTFETALGGWIGTPAYMSPEQAEITHDIDTRTDVYSLGVMLYEILVGLRPFTTEALQASGFDEMRRVIREVEPPRPSARVAAAAGALAGRAAARGVGVDSLARLLRGELDWIVMKALAKERERRYGSPGELARDIERYLHHEPLVAGPPSRLYRARKFARRHRFGVAAAAALVGTLVLGIGLATWQAVRATRAEARLLLRQEQAEDLIGFMLGDLRAKLEPLGRIEILDEVGDQAMGYFASLSRDELTPGELFRRSTALTQIGDVRISQGDLPEAQRAFEEALTLAADAVARDPANTERLAHLGAVHFWIGNVAWLRGELERARERFESYLDIAGRLVDMEPAEAKWRLELSYAHSNLGTVLLTSDDAALALEEFRVTGEIVRDLLEADPGNTDLERELASNLSWEAEALVAMGDLSASLERYGEARAIMERLSGVEPANLQWQYLLGIACEQEAMLRQYRGELNPAKRLSDRALELQQGLATRDPENSLWRRELAMARQRSAQILRAQGELQAAREQQRRAVEVFADLHRLDGSNARRGKELAGGLFEMARITLELDLPAEAEAIALDGIEVLRALPDVEADDRGTLGIRAEGLLVLGAARSALGNADQARADWQGVVDQLLPMAGESQNPKVLVPLAIALLELDQRTEAAVPLERLRRTGYREHYFVEVARRKGIPP